MQMKFKGILIFFAWYTLVHQAMTLRAQLASWEPLDTFGQHIPRHYFCGFIRRERERKKKKQKQNSEAFIPSAHSTSPMNSNYVLHCLSTLQSLGWRGDAVDTLLPVWEGWASFSSSLLLSSESLLSLSSWRETIKDSFAALVPILLPAAYCWVHSLAFWTNCGLLYLNSSD